MGACFKLVAPYVLLVFAMSEVLGWPRSRGGRKARLLAPLECVEASAGVFIGLLAVWTGSRPRTTTLPTGW